MNLYQIVALGTIIVLVIGLWHIGLVAWREGESKPRVQSVREISEERLQEMLLGAPDTPVWVGTLAVIDSLVPEIMNRAIGEKLGEGEMKFHLGGAGALLELKAILLEYEQEARELAREQKKV